MVLRLLLIHAVLQLSVLDFRHSMDWLNGLDQVLGWNFIQTQRLAESRGPYLEGVTASFKVFFIIGIGFLGNF